MRPWRRRFDTEHAALADHVMGAGSALLEHVATRPRSIATRHPQAATPTAAREALARIAANPGAPLTRAALATSADVSRFRLLRGFQRHLGMPPRRYIMQPRLALARRLLRAPRPPQRPASATRATPTAAFKASSA